MKATTIRPEETFMEKKSELVQEILMVLFSVGSRTWESEDGKHYVKIHGEGATLDGPDWGPVTFENLQPYDAASAMSEIVLNGRSPQEVLDGLN